jgi:hypothetical protein
MTEFISGLVSVVAIVVIGIGSSVANLFIDDENTYTAKDIKDSQYVDRKYEIVGDFAYIDGASHCNNVSKNEAINTICIQSEDAKYLFGVDINGDIGLGDEYRSYSNPNTKRLVLKKNASLTVVKEYSSTINDMWYRLFNGNISFLLLIDNDGNTVEMMEVMFRNHVMSGLIKEKL